MEKESSNWSEFFWHARFPVLPNVIAKPRTIPIFLGLACTASNFSMNFICKLKVRSHNGPALSFQRFLHQLPSLVALHSDNAVTESWSQKWTQASPPASATLTPTCTDCRPAPSTYHTARLCTLAVCYPHREPVSELVKLARCFKYNKVAVFHGYITSWAWRGAAVSLARGEHTGQTCPLWDTFKIPNPLIWVIWFSVSFYMQQAAYLIHVINTQTGLLFFLSIDSSVRIVSSPTRKLKFRSLH